MSHSPPFPTFRNLKDIQPSKAGKLPVNQTTEMNTGEKHIHIKDCQPQFLKLNVISCLPWHLKQFVPCSSLLLLHPVSMNKVFIMRHFLLINIIIKQLYSRQYICLNLPIYLLLDTKTLNVVHLLLFRSIIIYIFIWSTLKNYMIEI